MRSSPRSHQNWLTIVALSLALGALPTVNIGCNSGGGGGKKKPAPGPSPFAVAASPAGGTFAPGSTQSVSLSASGDGSAGARIFYTTDLSEPTNTSPEYMGPINITADTVLKFMAEASTGEETPITTEGYQFWISPSIAHDWSTSGHGDIAAEPWRHWDEDGAVSSTCARCHSPEGFLAYCQDSPAVEQPLTFGLTCNACHPNSSGPTLYDELASYPGLAPVAFPSGAEVSLFGPSNLCMTCHQGRSSKVQVDAAAPNTIVQTPADYDSYDFINIHYFAAAATLFGTEVKGGYEYDGLTYFDRNTFPSHPDGLSTCVGCHMGSAPPHNHLFLPQLETCNECHSGDDFETLSGSPGANFTAVQTLETELLAAIKSYATTVLNSPITYDGNAYPYFMKDNGLGASAANRYRDFDAKLLHAVYNYQVVQKDPGGFVHNGGYLQQLLHDSIVDLGGTPSVTPPGRTGFTPDANLFAAKTQEFHLSGHDMASGEPFRHWDPDYESPSYDPSAPVQVPTTCARCHTTGGFIDLLADGVVNAPASALTVVECTACHSEYNLFSSAATRFEDLATNPYLDPVTFPSGATVSLDGPSNLCMTCHQGRSSGPSVAAATPNTTVQAPVDYDSYSFINIHYYAAAASYFGSETHGGYEYGGRTYRARNTFDGHIALDGPITCVDCHMGAGKNHTWIPEITLCQQCHIGSDFEELSGSPGANHTLIEGLKTQLLTTIQAYATFLGYPIVYDPNAYPYFFNDTNANGVTDPDEATSANGYKNFDFDLLTAAYNYQVATKEPAIFVHNAIYARQLLYDSIDQVDGGGLDFSVVGQVRP